jgi:hypothetical protein
MEDSTMLDRLKKLSLLNAFGLALLVGVVASISLPLFTGGDFWVDEAMLVQGVLTRNFSGIISSPPDYSQSAPLGYLLVLKLFSLINRAEFMLRVPAFLFACGTLLMIYKIAKVSLRTNIPLFYAGIGGLFTTFMSYSAQAKQYTIETFAVLICVYCLDLYFNGKISTIKLAVIYASTVWFSFLSIFFAFGGICIILAGNLIAVIRKEHKFREFVKNNLPFVIVLISVLANLILWAIPGTKNIHPEEDFYWSKLSFPLIPTSMADLKLIFRMAMNIGGGFSKIGIVPVAIALVLLINFADNKGFKALFARQTIAIYFTCVACITASFFGKLPIISRILVFIYPMLLITAAFSIENNISILKRTEVKRVLALGFCLLFAVNFVYFARSKMTVTQGQQLSLSTEYVDHNIKDGEFIYVDFAALPQYSYLTDYKDKFDYFTYEVVEKGNIIYGARFRFNISKEPYAYVNDIDEDKLQANLNAISSHDSVYLLFAHEVPNNDTTEPREYTSQAKLVAALKEYGTVTLVQKIEGTPLYKFTK